MIIDLIKKHPLLPFYCNYVFCFGMAQILGHESVRFWLFKENDFAYSSEKENIHITVFKNNHIMSDRS